MPEKKILVVDDEPHVIRTLAFVFTKEGYEVSTARDGEEAMAKLLESKPSLMFLNFMMPKKNGYEVCQELESNSAFNYIHIVMLSAKGQEADKDKSLILGADEYLTKPVERAVLLEKLTALLDKEP